jgi:hypothetical protein
MMSELRIEPFKNKFDQTINPGDEVVYVATGYSHQVSVNRGRYQGLWYSAVGHYRDVLDADGNVVMEERYGRQYPKREYYREMAPVAVRLVNVPKGYKYTEVWDEEKQRKVWTKTDEMRYGTTTLPRKRVYKIDTSMLDFAGNTF